MVVLEDLSSSLTLNASDSPVDASSSLLATAGGFPDDMSSPSLLTAVGFSLLHYHHQLLMVLFLILSHPCYH